MDYGLLEPDVNGNMNTGNISTDDFLAVFSSTSPTEAAGSGPGGGSSSGLSNTSTATVSATATATATAANGSATTLNPPLLTVDGQFSAANFSSLLEGVGSSSASSSFVNDTFLLLGGPASSYNSSAINLLSPSTLGNYYNGSLANGSLGGGGNVTEIHFPGPYPSGYTLTHIVIASIIVTILMIIIVVGNMLVIIAIATEKSLKNIQNWFIASLAVADFFLGLIIMPFSLANELMGYWIFGSWWCDIHSAMDVLLCTASIMNLCLISLDRYWSITKAVEYLKSRTPARAAFMIAAVWIMSGLICIPPLLGWKVKMPEGPLPKCALSEDIGYVLYSALGSFYIPSCIMVFVYIRIYFAAKARARRGIKKHPRKTNNEQVTSFTTAGNKGTIPMPSSSGAAAALQLHQQRQIATIETPPNSASLPMQIPTVTCDLASDISTSEAAELEPHPLVYSNGNGNGSGAGGGSAGGLSPANALGLGHCKETLKVSTIATTHNALNAAAASLPPALGLNNNNNNNNNNDSSNPGRTTAATSGATTSGNSLSATTGAGSAAGVGVGAGTGAPNELRVSPVAGRCRALSVGIDTDMVSEFDPSSSDSGVVSRCAVVGPLKFRLCQPIFGRSKASAAAQQRRADAKAAAAATTAASKALAKAAEAAQSNATELEPAIPKVQKPRDPEKEKRRIARKKEKRATLILGLIMGSFIACWLPFFFLYILLPACNTHCHIPDSAFAIAFWLGYMNSALNPAIYTIFNKDFRRAFRRILFK